MWLHASDGLEAVLKVLELLQAVEHKDGSGGFALLTLQPQFQFPCVLSQANVRCRFC